MDEKAEFVARRLAGEAMPNSAGSSRSPANRPTRSSIATRMWVQGLTDRSSVPIAMPATSLSGGELYPEREARAHHLGCP